MQDLAKNYIQIVKEQVRWKLSHSEIETELADHITDQAKDYISQGFSTDAAYERAVKEMGDPYIIGSEFDSVYKPEINWEYIIFTAIFIGIGLVLNYIISAYRGIELSYIAVIQDSIKIMLGIGCLYTGYKLDFTVFMKYSLVVLAFMLFLFYFGYPFGIEVNGSRSWFAGPLLGRLEMTKLLLLFPLIFSGLIYRMRNKGVLAYLLCGLVYVITALFFSLYNRIGMLIVITLMTLPVMIYAVNKNWFGKELYLKTVFYIIGVLGIAFSIYTLIFDRGYRMDRIRGAFWPQAEPSGLGYSSLTVRDILASSSFIGTAPGGVDIGNRLASYYNDFKLVFAAQKAGILAVVLIIALIILFIGGLYRKCFRQKSFQGKMAALAVVNTFALQFLFYIMINTGFYLVTVSLPFMDYNGLGFWINMFLLGILLSVFTCEKLNVGEKVSLINSNEKQFLQYENKKLILDFNRFGKEPK